MNPPSAKLDASLMFRILKMMCPFFFFAISLGGTLSQDDFTWANGSYSPVFAAWLFAYGLWAAYTRYESAVSGFMLTEKSNAKEVGDKLNTMFAQHPFSWPAKIEFLVFALTFIVAMYLPEFGFPILWLTTGHFLFVFVWRKIAPRYKSTPSAT
jgi:hypothetical protein